MICKDILLITFLNEAELVFFTCELFHLFLSVRPTGDDGIECSNKGYVVRGWGIGATVCKGYS